ncbi:glycosyltransferase family 4 protein [Allocoleopsis sp.]|uniref:glycosyltransferase family 4 protein n=1 Tax=Allocoleopsis sp. TaxID=3088169 RepID=UPI002FCEB2D4
MRIAFIDFANWDYTLECAYQMPMGGSESALCYLAEALAKQGHDVFLLNNTLVPKMSRGVICLPLNTVPQQLLQSLDAAIMLKLAGQGMHIKPLIGENTCLILWTQHAHDQPAVEALENPLERDIYDGFALVSDWQRDRFHENFGINLTRIEVLRNAIAPSFCGLFPDTTPILAQKSKPPILAYTSTPFRGLDILLDVFPRIRSAVPGTRLKVFSSMKVYQVAEAEDESQYGSLYRRCQETTGVEYLGSLPQPDLACELQSVLVFAYPNSFAETSCIAVMEAMASGCSIVTSDLGALPETTAGFARLIPIEDDWEVYKDRFVEETVQLLRKCTATDTTDTETHLRQQVEYVNCEYTWPVRAQQWVQWLSNIGTKTAIATSVMPLDSTLMKSADLALLAYQCLIYGEYHQAATFYEQAIEAYPTVMSNYWYLGLTLLLQGQEEDAQATWMLAMMNAESEQADLWKAELVKVLEAEAHRRKALVDDQTAQLIEQYITDMTT